MVPRARFEILRRIDEEEPESPTSPSFFSPRLRHRAVTINLEVANPKAFRGFAGSSDITDIREIELGPFIAKGVRLASRRHCLHPSAPMFTTGPTVTIGRVLVCNFLFYADTWPALSRAAGFGPSVSCTVERDERRCQVVQSQ